MLKKIFSLVFVLSLAVSPLASHAGFFDIFRTSRNYQNTAQLKSLTTNVVGLKRGDKSEVVLQVQQALTEAKLYAGDLSGLIGPKTESAIKAWQTSHGLAVTGILDATTVSSILGRGGESVGGNRDGIQCAGSAPQIMVTSPNGGESYQIGGQIEVTWETCNIPASELIYITIGTSASGQGHAFLTTGGTGTPNDGTETFTLSDTLPAGQYYVSAFRPAPNYLRDFSDNSFTLEASMVCTPQSEPWVKVLSPNGGENYTAGQQITMTWTSCNINNPVWIGIMKINPDLDYQPNGQLAGFTSMSTPNDGSEVVTLPDHAINGVDNFWYSGEADYRVMVTEFADGGPGVFLPKDFSDDEFVIGEEVAGGDTGIGENCPDFGPLLIATTNNGEPTAVLAHPNSSSLNQVLARFWLYPVCDITLYDTVINNNGFPSIENSTPYTTAQSVFSSYKLYKGQMPTSNNLIGQSGPELGSPTITHENPLQLYANQPQLITIAVDLLPGASGTAQTCLVGFNVTHANPSPLYAQWTPGLNATNKLLGNFVCQNKVSIVLQ